MVRVGGGWVALDEFLIKNDPCRGTYTFDTVLLNISTNIIIKFKRKIVKTIYHEYTHKIEDANHNNKMMKKIENTKPDSFS